MMSYLVADEHPGAAIPLVPLRKSDLAAWQAKATTRQQRWLSASGFEARPGQCLALPDDDGNVQACIFGMQEEGWLYQLAAIYRSLPQGCYVLTADWTDRQVFQATLGWGLAAYRYERY